MRDAKFRVFRNGEMVYDDSDIAINRTTKMMAYKNNRHTLPFMQFTGLTDKNGVEIYEGDILYCEIEEYKGSVFFRGGQFLTEARGWGDLPLADDVDDYSVIGNIHENPELLNG